ncbi:MAG TPA: type VI secretion system protein TssA [Pyrinomonadaceae bacterium]|jgi:type VI secretion system ImpA family protein
MSTPTTHVFDLEALFAPIAADRPSGESLSHAGTYDRIREARREDDPRLSQGIYKAELKRAEWDEVESLCLVALATRSKDLQIAAWLMEAWLHLYGFAGAREGVQLLAALCEHFWDDVHPRPEPGDDWGARVAPFEWIDQKLPLRLKLLPVSAPRSADALPYSYADWEGACELDNLSKRDPKAAESAEARGRVSLSTFSTSLMLTDDDFFASLYSDTGEAAEACAALERMLDERCGRQAPSLRSFREALLAVRQLAADVLGSRPTSAEYAGGEQDEAEEADDSEGGGVGPWPSNPIRSRAEAYRRLAEAADYLQRTEPHSPTPYLVRRAVEWGSMNLHEVLQQIVRNEGEMQEINRLLRLTGAGDPSR